MIAANDNFELIQGDCLEVMADAPESSVDLILCDLPYGTTQNNWDSVIPLDKLWPLYWRVAKPNAAVVLTAQCPFDKTLGVSCLKYLKYEWFWVKPTATGFLNAKKSPLKNVENVLVFYKKPPTYNPQMRLGFKPYKAKPGGNSSNYGAFSLDHVTVSNGERYPISTLEFKPEKGLHPTQKPVALMEYLIRTYTNEGDTVLDNCMGSGTTGVAARNTGRAFVGIERDPAYFAIAEQRIRAVEPPLGLVAANDNAEPAAIAA